MNQKEKRKKKEEEAKQTTNIEFGTNDIWQTMVCTYKSIASGFPRLPIGDNNSLLDVSKHFKILSQAGVSGVIRKASHEDLGEGSVFLCRVHDLWIKLSRLEFFFGVKLNRKETRVVDRWGGVTDWQRTWSRRRTPVSLLWSSPSCQLVWHRNLTPPTSADHHSEFRLPTVAQLLQQWQGHSMEARGLGSVRFKQR